MSCSKANSGVCTPITTAPRGVYFRAHARTYGQGTQPVDARIRAEIDNDDFSEQGVRRQAWRIEPLVRAADGRQLTWGTLVRCHSTNQGGARSSNRHCHTPEKTSPFMIDARMHVVHPSRSTSVRYGSQRLASGISARRDRRPFSPVPFRHHVSGTRAPSRSGSGAASRSRAPVPRRDPNRDGNRRPARVRSH